MVAESNGSSGLTDQRVFEWMVGVDEVVVSRPEPIDVGAVGNSVELPVCSSVAIDTGENEIPDLIKVFHHTVPLKNMRKDMIDVSEIC